MTDCYVTARNALNADEGDLGVILDTFADADLQADVCIFQSALQADLPVRRELAERLRGRLRVFGRLLLSATRPPAATLPIIDPYNVAPEVVTTSG